MKNRSLRDVVAGSLAARGAEGLAATTRGTATERSATRRGRQVLRPRDRFLRVRLGESFHFAPRAAGETLPASILRLEHLVARRLDLGPSMKVLDAGCGIGGPMRSIARLCGASVEGSRSTATRWIGPMRSARATGSRIGVAPSRGTSPPSPTPTDLRRRLLAGGDVSRLRPLGRAARAGPRREAGGLVAGTDWCTTGAFRPDEPEHVRIVRGIEEGNGLAPLISTEAFQRAFADAGLELLEARDLARAGPGTSRGTSRCRADGARRPGCGGPGSAGG